MQLARVLVLALIAWSAGVLGNECSKKEANAAEARIEQLNSWQKISDALKQFGHCDDGVIAEGNSEAVARLLIDHWRELPQLAAQISENPALKVFVLRHIDESLDGDDVKRIAVLAESSCPDGLSKLCGELKTTARRTARHMDRN